MLEKRPDVLLVARSFIISDGKILAVQRTYNDRHNCYLWEAPGGKLKKGQDLQSALLHEVKEETGLQILPIDNVVHCQSYVMKGGHYDGVLYVAHFSISIVESGTLKLSNEHDDGDWYTYANFMKLDLTCETKQAAGALEERLRAFNVR